MTVASFVPTFTQILLTNLNTFASVMPPEVNLRKELGTRRIRDMNACLLQSIDDPYDFHRSYRCKDYFLHEKPKYPPVHATTPPRPLSAGRCAACPFKRRNASRMRDRRGMVFFPSNTLRLTSQDAQSTDYTSEDEESEANATFKLDDSCSCGDLWDLQKRVKKLESMLLDVLESFLKCDDISFLERESLKLQIYHDNLKMKKRPTLIREELKRILKFKYGP
tara:strand:- start:1054 stop:1719 length:666 start_codon:yes stop_codon:yes gene_type:complete